MVITTLQNGRRKTDECKDIARTKYPFHNFFLKLMEVENFGTGGLPSVHLRYYPRPANSDITQPGQIILVVLFYFAVTKTTTASLSQWKWYRCIFIGSEMV